MEHHAADQLDIEMTHFQHPLAGFAADREGFLEQGIERLAVGDALFELRRLGLQLGVGEFLDDSLERIDLAYGLLILLEQSRVAAAKNLGQ